MVANPLKYEGGTLSRGEEQSCFTSGEALERWMLKAAAGHFFSKNASSSEGTVLFDDHGIDMHLVQRALFAGHWQIGLRSLHSRARNHVQNCGRR
jgi:hypothetical protein